MSEEKHQLALTVNHAGVYYRRRVRIASSDHYWALKDISFNLYHGETLGIIGRNGVGKSTLLRLLAGIIAPDRGEVRNYVGHAALLSLQVGFVTHLTGRENAILSGMLLGMTRRELRQKMEGIIAFSGLCDFIDEPVGTYSSGMRARLGFAVAYQAKPDILLVDEVLGVGDSEFKQKSTAVMSELIRSDQTVVIVSHSIDTLRRVCDRVLWLEGGVTKSIGSASEVLSAYEQVISSLPPQESK